MKHAIHVFAALWWGAALGGAAAAETSPPAVLSDEREANVREAVLSFFRDSDCLLVPGEGTELRADLFFPKRGVNRHEVGVVLEEMLSTGRIIQENEGLRLVSGC